MLGANTDPYQPVEREMRVTRSILEVLARTRHPVSIITKSAMVLRDRDLLTDMAKDGLGHGLHQHHDVEQRDEADARAAHRCARRPFAGAS